MPQKDVLQSGETDKGKHQEEENHLTVCNQLTFNVAGDLRRFLVVVEVYTCFHSATLVREFLHHMTTLMTQQTSQ